MANKESLSTKLTDGQLKELLDAHMKEGIPEPDREARDRETARLASLDLVS